MLSDHDGIVHLIMGDNSEELLVCEENESDFVLS